MLQNWRRDLDAASSGYLERDIVTNFLMSDIYSYASQNPIQYMDNHGLFSSRGITVHKNISRQAFGWTDFEDECGIDVKDEAIKWSNDYDFVPGSQEIAMAPTHAMTPEYSKAGGSSKLRNGRGSKALAQIQWLAFIEENMSKCDGMGLGFALHAVQDNSARYHKGFQYWDGGHSMLWFDGVPNSNHIMADTFPSIAEFTEAQFASAVLIQEFMDRCKEKCQCSSR